MDSPTQEARGEGGYGSTLWLAVLVPGALLVAAFLSTWVYQSLQGTGGWLEDALLGRGPHKLMRRIAMVLLVLTLPILLRRTCWGGLRDLGTGPRVDGRAWFAGLGLGVATLGPIALLTVLLGYRVPDTDLVFLPAALKVLRYALSALVVGVSEEILTRGILFRSLARAWGVLAAALVTSIFFAVGHFVSPDPAAYADGPLLNTTFAVLGSLVPQAAGQDYVVFQVVNLTLMGCAMCALVARTGTIWLAAGVHGGWVFIKLANSYLMDIDPQVPRTVWLGHRSDNLDSILCSVMLVSIILLARFAPMPWVQKTPRTSPEHE